MRTDKVLIICHHCHYQQESHDIRERVKSREMFIRPLREPQKSL